MSSSLQPSVGEEVTTATLTREHGCAQCTLHPRVARRIVKKALLRRAIEAEYDHVTSKKTLKAVQDTTFLKFVGDTLGSTFPLLKCQPDKFWEQVQERK